MAVGGVDGDPSAGGERGILAVSTKAVGDALGDEECGFGAGFRENNDKFVSAVTGDEINLARMETKNVGEAAKSAAADQVAVPVVNFLQMIKVQ